MALPEAIFRRISTAPAASERRGNNLDAIKRALAKQRLAMDAEDAAVRIPL